MPRPEPPCRYLGTVVERLHTSTCYLLSCRATECPACLRPGSAKEKARRHTDWRISSRDSRPPHGPERRTPDRARRNPPGWRRQEPGWLPPWARLITRGNTPPRGAWSEISCARRDLKLLPPTNQIDVCAFVCRDTPWRVLRDDIPPRDAEHRPKLRRGSMSLRTHNCASLQGRIFLSRPLDPFQNHQAAKLKAPHGGAHLPHPKAKRRFENRESLWWLSLSWLDDSTEQLQPRLSNNPFAPYISVRGACRFA